jgi:hypothetical protein
VVRARFRLLSENGLLCEKGNKCIRFGGRDVTAEFRIGECAPELVEELVRSDEFEIADAPAREQPRRSAAGGEEGCDEDVGVEDGAHSALAASRRMLRFDRKTECLLFGHAIALPETFEQIEAELPPKRFLDDLAVAFPGAGSMDPYGAQDVFVDRQCCPHLRHISIIAS